MNRSSKDEPVLNAIILVVQGTKKSARFLLRPKQDFSLDQGFSLIEMAIVLAVISLIVAGISSGKETMAKAYNIMYYQRNLISCMEGGLAGAPVDAITLDTGWVCAAAQASSDPQIAVERILTVTAPAAVKEKSVALIAAVGNNSLERTFGVGMVTSAGQVITVILPVEHNLGAKALTGT